jgi:hypothetical protein
MTAGIVTITSGLLPLDERKEAMSTFQHLLTYTAREYSLYRKISVVL